MFFFRYKLNKRGDILFDSNGKNTIEFLAIEKNKSRLRFPSVRNLNKKIQFFNFFIKVMQEKNMSVVDLVERDILNEVFDFNKIDSYAIGSILKKPINVFFLLKNWIFYYLFLIL